jgi:16S rRNA processing protein RimM
MSDEPTVKAGRVARPHGLDGSFYVAEPVATLLDLGSAVQVAGSSRLIERRAGTDAKPIIRLEGSTNRDDAESLRGEELRVPRREVPALGADEWWTTDLIGLDVVDGQIEVGSIAGVLGLPSCEVLDVTRDDGTHLLVPMIGDAVRTVDLKSRKVDIDLRFLGEQT